MSLNDSFGPPPLATPITVDGPDETGVPYQHRVAQGGVPSGNLAVAWSTWFAAAYQKIINAAQGDGILQATENGDPRNF